MSIAESVLLVILYAFLYIIVTTFISGVFVSIISYDEDDFFFCAWVLGAILYVVTIIATGKG